MNTKNLVISVFLVGLMIVVPTRAEAGFWQIIDPFGVNKIIGRINSGDLDINEINQVLLEENQAYFGFSLIQNDSVMAIRSPITPRTYMPKTIYIVAATGYSSTPDQTDSNPFITAAGTHVRDGVAAANFLPFGTIFKIPELFGDKTFIVEDRMHGRYWLNIDIWFPEREMAKEFGLKKVKIEIIS